MRQLFAFSTALLLSITLLTGCGWHLRGYDSINSNLTSLYLQSPGENSDLTRTFRRGLRAAGVTLTETRSEAPYTLVVLNENQRRRTLSTSDGGKVAEYELNSTIRFQVESATGDLVLGPEQVETIRVYVFDRNNVASTYEEEQLLRKEMRQEMVRQVIRRFQAVEPVSEESAEPQG